jgi:hypothetical protein
MVGVFVEGLFGVGSFLGVGAVDDGGVWPGVVDLLLPFP